MSVGSLVSTGPLLLAIPVAAAAGAVTFLSPCVLPLVPGYLSYITGMSGDAATRKARSGQVAETVTDDTNTAAVGATDPGTPGPGTPGPGTPGPGTPGPGTPGPGAAGPGAAPRPVPALAGTATATALNPRELAAEPRRSRAMAGAALFVAGFAALFGIEGIVVGGIGGTLKAHEAGLSRLLGVVLILLGLLFAGAFDRFSFSGRILKPSFRPKAGLTTAPLIGLLFGLGWTPCAGPTLGAVLALGLSTGTAARGGLLAFVYALGIGIPFLVVAFAVDRGVAMFGFARRHAKRISQIGGLLLIIVGVLEVTGAWTGAVTWLKLHWLASYNAPF